MSSGLPVAHGAVVNLTGDEEPSLVERFARGETAAFVRVVADHRDFVARLAHRLLGWPRDVEDIVQDVFPVRVGASAKVPGPEHAGDVAGGDHGEPMPGPGPQATPPAATGAGARGAMRADPAR